MRKSKKTIYYYIKEYAQKFPSRRILFDESATYTAKEFLLAVEEAAAFFYGDGLRPGDRAAFKFYRDIDTAITFFALQVIGAVCVAVDPHDDAANVLKKSEIGARIIPKINWREVFKKNFSGESFLKGEEFVPMTDSSLPTIIIFTSGSTGGSKAVALSQYAFINNSLDTFPLGDYRADDINMAVIPFYHVFGMAMLFTAIVLKHAVFVPQRADIPYVAECIERYKITRMNGVPTLYRTLAEAGDKYSFSSLRCGLIGGAPCGEKIFREIEKRLGAILIPVYGMSECIGISCASFMDGVNIRAEAVGKPYSMNSVKISEEGEILVKSPALFNGYFVGGKVIPALDEEYFSTGDLGRVDEDGFVHIIGRKKDIIIRNGNNLSSIEIENKISSLPFVKSAVVVGVDSEALGEAPCAAIALKRGTICDEKTLSSALSAALTKIEMPVKIKLLESIPLLSSGKPDKVLIKNMFFCK